MRTASARYKLVFLFLIAILTIIFYHNLHYSKEVWISSLLTRPAGEKRTLRIPHELAYGERGFPPGMFILAIWPLFSGLGSCNPQIIRFVISTFMLIFFIQMPFVVRLGDRAVVGLFKGWLFVFVSSSFSVGCSCLLLFVCLEL